MSSRSKPRLPLCADSAKADEVCVVLVCHPLDGLEATVPPESDRVEFHDDGHAALGQTGGTAQNMPPRGPQHPPTQVRRFPGSNIRSRARASSLVWGREIRLPACSMKGVTPQLVSDLVHPGVLRMCHKIAHPLRVADCSRAHDDIALKVVGDEVQPE